MFDNLTPGNKEFMLEYISSIEGGVEDINGENHDLLGSLYDAYREFGSFTNEGVEVLQRVLTGMNYGELVDVASLHSLERQEMHAFDIYPKVLEDAGVGYVHVLTAGDCVAIEDLRDREDSITIVYGEYMYAVPTVDWS